MVTCKEFLRELNEFLDDSADSKDRQELERHVSNCPNCWVVLDTTKKTIQVYKGMDPQPLPAGVHGRLMKALEARCAAKTSIQKDKAFMTTQEVADALAKLCAAGKFDEAMNTLYSPDIVSVEAGAPPGGSRETKGLEGVRQKGEWWTSNHDVHSAAIEGPVVAGSHIALAFKFDVTYKPENKRFQMEEIALYKVVDGKIVYEEFFYNM